MNVRVVLTVAMVMLLRDIEPCGKIFAGHSGRAVWGVGLGRLVAGIVGSNPAQGMDVCLRLSMLCCSV
jgi:hypothetical protein